MNDLAISTGARIAPVIPRNLEEVATLSRILCASGMAPRDMKTPESIAVAIMHGMELGLPPMMAVQSIAVINGRPSVWGDALPALVYQSGLMDGDIEEELAGQGEALVAKCTVKRKGRGPITRTFSLVDAKRAKLLEKDGPWKTYTPRMMAMRARSWCLRDAFPDVVKGLAIAEEQMEVADLRHPDQARIEAPKPRRIAPEPPAEDEPPRAAKESEVDWDGQLAAYDSAISACEAHESLNEAVSTLGGVFVDAPEAIQAEAKKLEAAKRSYIERQEPAQ